MEEEVPLVVRPLCASKNGKWEQVQDEEGNWYCPPDPYIEQPKETTND